MKILKAGHGPGTIAALPYRRLGEGACETCRGNVAGEHGMKRLAFNMVVAAGLVSALATAGLVYGAGQNGDSRNKQRHPVTKADYERWKTELSNWGRWGRDDQMGALNLITPAKRKQPATPLKAAVTVPPPRAANPAQSVA